MRDSADRPERPPVGHPAPDRALGRARLPRRIALPALAPTTLSSAGYAPDEILIALAVAGLAASAVPLWIALAVVAVLALVVASYSLTLQAHPRGGGDYEAVSADLGPRAALGAACALLCDHLLTVAVSVSAAAGYLASAVPALAPFKTPVAVGALTALALIGLRGPRESAGGAGRAGAAALLTCLFMAAIGAMAVAGLVQELTGTLGRAPSAGLEIVSASGWDRGLGGLAGALIVMRALSSGCAALTGLGEIPAAVPGFQRPRTRNAVTALLALGAIAAAVLVGLIHLAGAVGARMVEDPAHQLARNGAPVGRDYHQDPLIGQIAAAVFSASSPMTYLVTALTALVLLLAAGTAVNRATLLARALARDELLPRQLAQRGDRLARSACVLLLCLGAAALVIGFRAGTGGLIRLYIVGILLCLTLSQAGMVRHWNRRLSTATDPAARRRMRRSRIISALGAAATALLLAAGLITGLARGAWIALLIMALLCLVMSRIRSHYRRVDRELAIPDPQAQPLPAHVHAVVLVSRLHQPTLRALGYARSTHPASIEAVTVDAGDGAAQRLLEDWLRADLPVALTVLDSPRRDPVRSVVEHVRSVRRDSPRDLVVVFLPEYLVHHWWQGVLHNRASLRLRTALLATPGVVVASVPWQLGRPGRTGIDRGRRGAAPGGGAGADTAAQRAEGGRPSPGGPARPGAPEPDPAPSRPSDPSQEAP